MDDSLGEMVWDGTDEGASAIAAWAPFDITVIHTLGSVAQWGVAGHWEITKFTVTSVDGSAIDVWPGMKVIKRGMAEDGAQHFTFEGYVPVAS